VATWPACARLLPHVLVVIDHAQALDVEAETAARLLNEAAAYLRSRAQYQQARQLQEQALAGFRWVLGDDHPDTLTAMNSLGEAADTSATCKVPATCSSRRWTSASGCSAPTTPTPCNP